jgi:cytoskeletal protein CcmA (bactofilin family)
MSSTTYIGKTIRIKGTVTADEPFTIAGTVEGTISVKGHPVTVAPEGTLNADAKADSMLVEGAATGSLTAESRLTLRATANVTGEIHAPVLSVAEGAKLQGKVAAGARKTERAA